MFCAKCGAPLAEDALFCENCGLRQVPQQQPQMQQPVYQEPVHQQPMYQQPAYQQPAYQQPAYQQPAYQQPAYQQPAYQQPAYQQPAYQQPAYQQPAYQQPAYQQPAYQQPNYQPQQYTAPQGMPAGSGASTMVKAAAKGGMSAMKWLLLAVAVVGVLAFVVIQFDLLNVFKSDEDLIRERIAAFEDAYNSTDWDGILDCMDEGTRITLEMTMGFAEGLLGEAAGMDISISDMFAMSGLFLGGDFCQIEILDIRIDGDYAEVTVSMNVEMYDYSATEEAVLPMVKEGNDWYITAMGDLFGY